MCDDRISGASEVVPIHRQSDSGSGPAAATTIIRQATGVVTSWWWLSVNESSCRWPGGDSAAADERASPCQQLALPL